jgi:hypothetical protein
LVAQEFDGAANGLWLEVNVSVDENKDGSGS